MHLHGVAARANQIERFWGGVGLQARLQDLAGAGRPGHEHHRFGMAGPVPRAQNQKSLVL